MSYICLAAIIIGFILLILLNTFLVYIPVNKIENALVDIDNKVKDAAIIIEPLITKVTPLLETL